MTNPALAQFLIGLMNVAAIALLMLGETRRRTFRRSMTGAALRRRSLFSHLLRIHMLLVRERLDPKLAHPGRKAYSRPLSVNRRRVTHSAHLTRGVCKILCVAFDARRVAGEHRRHVVVRTLMAERAVLSLGLVLGSHMVKRRRPLDHLGFLYIERRWRRRRLRRGRRRFGGFVGGGLLGALASKRADEKNRRHTDDDKS